MNNTVLLVGLDVHQADACRSGLGEGQRMVCALDACEGLSVLSIHRPRLVVIRSDVERAERKVLAALADRYGARVISIPVSAQPATIERLVEGAASLAFGRGGEEEPVRSISGTRARMSPGTYRFTAADRK